MRIPKFVAVASTVIGISACQSIPLPGQTERLTREIADIEARVATAENAIDLATSEISTTEEAIGSRIRYRPIVAWAEAFSAGPASGRTITFRQTSKSGNIDRRAMECRAPFGPYRDGWEARIHEENSTRASVVVNRFTVEPQADGLRMTAPLSFDLRTQVEGSFRPRCTGWLPSVNIGVTGEARPTAVFRLTLRGAEGDALRYRLEMVSPQSVGLEMRAHFPQFRVGFTIPVDGLADTLAEGEIDLLLSRDGEIRLPDGEVVGYRLNLVDPRVSTDTVGVQFTSGVNVVIGDGAAAGR